MNTEREFLIALSTFPSFGPRRLKLLLSYFETSKKVWTASKEALREVGVTEKIIFKFDNHRKKIDLEGYFKKLRLLKILTITINESHYPTNLKEIADAPYVLYVRGSIEKKDLRGIGVVGTRKMTSYGKDVCEMITLDLCRYGITIISGFARGIDTTAHKAAIKSKGRTIAVMPCGLDTIYPPENIHIVDDVSKNGALISEYPLGYPAIPENFPQRNRIISGLSKGVLVIEGQHKSGTLLTAKHAAEQGRTVYAVPGNITSVMSEAPNFLIKEGATLVLSVSDIIEELGVDTHPLVQDTLFPQDALEEELLSILTLEPLHLDEVVRIAGKGTGEVSGKLTIMELKGMVKHLGGGVYKRV